MLTVDTHFPNGYVCPLCPDTYDEQYANVYACASKQVVDFVRWAQTQDWYPDTTIVISGDHPTMDHNFCKNVPEDYVRKVYTVYINAPVQPETEDYRDYTTFDAFPTTLASLGVSIEGNRLGLGTNLFSKEKTLSERFGRDYEKGEIEKKSELMVKLGQIDKAAAIESREAKELKEKEESKKAAEQT